MFSCSCVHIIQVCGTDVHLKHRRLNTVPDPIIPGHVSVGTVFAVSGRVVDVEGQEVHSRTSALFPLRWMGWMGEADVRSIPLWLCVGDAWDDCHLP